jgi:hypothetical protein
VIAEPLSLEDRPTSESATAPRTHSQPAAEPSASVEVPSLTLAGVTSTLQLILATRRAARVDQRLES